MDNEYLRLYESMLAHQREHGGVMSFGDEQQPSEMCMGCLKERRYRSGGRSHDVKLRFSWAVPNDQALKTIAAHSPHGVVEIGAGGGYWTGLLRSLGVDVIAYDPTPKTSDWHDGRGWSEVLQGDHTAVIGHADRTLLLCWPCYDEAWTHEVVELYDGDTVVYVGEGSGGCTGTDRMHELLGEETYCWHDDEPCDCERPDPKFREVETVDIPQWWGMHDRLTVFKRIR